VLPLPVTCVEEVVVVVDVVGGVVEEIQGEGQVVVVGTEEVQVVAILAPVLGP